MSSGFTPRQVLDRRRALQAITLGAAAVAGGARLTDALAATPTAQVHPDAGLQHRATPLVTPTAPVAGTTYRTFAGTDFHPRLGTPNTFDSGTGVSFGSTTNDYFVKNVEVPNGSVITECECYFVNNDAGTFFLELEITDPSADTRDTVNTTSSGAISATPSTLRIASMTGLGATPLDTSRYGVQILAGNGARAVLYGARIGYVAGSPDFHTITPARVYDSRLGAGFISSGQVRTISTSTSTTSTPVVPAAARAVLYNLTVTNTASAGFLGLYPAGGTYAGNSSINWFGSGITIANGGMVGLGGDRQVTVYCGGGATDFIVDITGYFL